MAKHDDVKEDKAMISKAVHKHETHMHKGHGLTKLSGGGPTSAMRKKYGRNMAKVVNQRGHSRGS